MARLALLVVLVQSLFPAGAYAESWKILGPRPMGMGGAFVAMAQGGLAQYWNPAGLAQDAAVSNWGGVVTAGGRVEFTGGILKDANTLGDLANKFTAMKSAQASGTAGAADADEFGAFYAALNAINGMNEPGKGALVDIAGGGNFSFKRFAVSMNNFTSLGASPFVDLVNIGLGPGTGVSGLSFANAGTTLCGGGSCTGAPADSTNAASASTIQSSLSSQFTQLDALTGGALTAGGVTSGNIGNVLVNIAATNGASTTDIANAATQISQNAAAAAPFIAAGASGSSYTNNRSNLTIRGGSFNELAFGYGHKLPVPGLHVGGNLKAIFGEVGYARYNVMEKDAGSTNSLKDYKSNTAKSAQPGVDLGVLWHVNQTLPVVPLQPRVGLVARNINNPKFDQPALAKVNGEGSKYALNPQLRMGLAVSPFKFWNVAADMDLTRNLTPVAGYKSQMFGLGTEVNVFNRPWINIPLRAGIMKNVADSASAMSYTAGFGVNFLHFMLDVGGSISSEQTTIQGSQKVPSNAAVAAQFGIMF